MSKTKTGSVLVLLLLCTAMIFAQESEGVRVQVTAERVEEEELKTSAHTTIITAEEIAGSGATSIVDVLEKVTGVQFRSYAGPEQAQVNMRGFGENSFGRVLVLLDGKRLNKMDMQGIQWLSIPLESIERIEVVRGGNSVLYGNNAVGGVINIITHSTVSEREFSSTILFGGYLSEYYGWSQINQQQVHAGFGASKYSLDVDFERQSTDGYRDRTAFETMGTAVDFEGRPTDLIISRVGVSYNQSSYEMPGGLSKEEFEETPERANNTEDEGEEYVVNVDGGIEWLPTASTSVFLDGGYEYQWRGVDMSSWSSFSDTVYHSGQINPRLVLDLPYGFLPVKVVAGGDVYLSALEKADYSDKGRDTEDLSYTYNTSLDSFGGYADFSISPTDELGISAGARYDTARVKAEKKAADLDETVWHRALVYNGALRYNPSAESKVYLKGGTIFRYPFIDEQSSLTGFFGAEELYTDIKPETGWEIEAGGSFFTGKAFSSSASVYLLLIEDEIAYNPDEGRSTNLDDTRRLGGDIELSLDPVKQVGADISYSYVQAAFASGDNEGNTIPLVPAHTVRGSLRLIPFQSLNIEPAFSFVSEAYQGGDNENSEELVDSYWLADLVIRYQLPVDYDLRIVLRCENLLDEVYAPYVYWDKYSHAYYPAAGRSLTLGVTYSY